MDDIISKLAEIEAAASRIMEDVSEQKKQLTQEFEASAQEFDLAVEKEMQEKSQKIRSELEIKMKEQLDKQQQQTEAALNKMEAYYQECHTKLAEQIYDRILRM